MSTSLTEWGGVEQRPSPIAFIPVAVEEARRHPVMLLGVFAAIAISALVLGMLLPKRYTSSTTILVEESNIIAPLMEGRAVPTGVATRASIAREVAFSRRVMNQILRVGGWMARDPDPVTQDALIDDITQRTAITNPRENLIQITYTDSNPKRSYDVTTAFANLVIKESLDAKERESRQAYDFIDSQVSQYHDKLTDAESKLEQYRKSNPDARPGVEADVNSRIGELRRQVETGRMDLIDLHSQEGALQSQLAGESEVTVVQTRASQLRARLIELQSQRDTLLLNDTEQHPDVVRLQHQISDLQDELAQEAKHQDAGDAGTDDNPAAYNPLYEELRSKLADAHRKSAATEARVGTANTLLQQELDRSGDIASSESSLAELTRDYEVNRDLYQDLLKRRENARVSMNLDSEHRGLSFRIQEPASMPLRPSGLRLMHVAGAGLALAVLVPLALLFGLLRLDPRVRAPHQVEMSAGLPVLGTVPALVTGPRRRRFARRMALASGLFLSVPLVYGLVFTLKLVHAL